MSLAFIFPFVLEVVAEIKETGKGGSGVDSSPKEEVEERAD